MKNYLLILCLFFTVFIAKAQVNLVPNPSFEDTLVTFPSYTFQIKRAKYWQRSGYGTPDYFHRLSPINSNVSIPNNLFGNQNTANPDCEAYVGIIPYLSFGGVREFISAKLINQLVIGTKYFVSFKVSLADTVTLATNKLGILFTTWNYTDTTLMYPIGNFSHIVSDSIISDKNNWVQVNGSFIADSSYSYLTIGNFYNQSNVDTSHLTTSIATSGSYYYIDDVCVSIDSLFCNNYSQNCTITNLNNSSVEKFEFYPNPFSNSIKLFLNNLSLKKITVFDIIGKPIIREEFSENEFTLYTENLTPGVYILRIFDTKTFNESNHIVLKTN
ncbi:MAG: T9SS type A sorting domain-containing protein [Bacteroidia bacterium]|nr:T9SS type A sorting domain-containing protein [Bacteroidia bacterium]MCZ2356106.1 T9SS type A sorting domain-containing protein [Bacteroidia bacterium]